MYHVLAVSFMAEGTVYIEIPMINLGLHSHSFNCLI